jgi:hypothetical protein
MTNTNVPVIDGAWEAGSTLSRSSAVISSWSKAATSMPRREIDDGRSSAATLLSHCQRRRPSIRSRRYSQPVQGGGLPGTKSSRFDVLAGKVKGRTDDKQIILYKNQGGKASPTSRWRRSALSWPNNMKGYEMKIEPRQNWWVQGGRAETW